MKKTQILRKYRKYQNKIDIYYGFYNKKWKKNETEFRFVLEVDIPKKPKIKLWEYR